MRVINKIAFPNPNFICSIIFSIKMRVFLAAALDMSFKIYDRKLDLLESIRHDERAILQLKYDAIDDVFLASGASGKSSMMLNSKVCITLGIDSIQYLPFTTTLNDLQEVDIPSIPSVLTM